LVPGSKLSGMFLGNFDLKQVLQDGQECGVFIDRNPVIFSHVIDYLRNNRKVLPQNIHQDLK